MCDLFLVLAQAAGGLTCFLVPRVLPDGTRNTFRIQRLKDKLGNRSNASSEPEFEDTVAWRVGDEGRGVRTIIEMVACTRLDNVLGSAARHAGGGVAAAHHARYRSAFGRTLLEQPLMREVLADLALESEAAVTLALRLAGAQDRAPRDEHEAAFRRIGVTLGKYWICKRQTAVVGEALECLGGNGYVEESGMPRLFRESPLNSIWEGSGNVNALDLLRILAREPASLEAWRAEVSGVDDRIDAGRKEVEADLVHADERDARRLTERMAVLLSGALLVRHAPTAVADAYVSSRVAGDHGQAFGTLPRGVDVDALLARLPEHLQERLMDLMPGVRAAEVDGRIRTHYLESGPSDGEPVVLVHGNLSTGRFYEHLMPGAPERWRLLAPDMRCFGRSEAAPIDATRGLGDWADDLEGFLDALGIDRPVHLVGWSTGGRRDRPGRAGPAGSRR